MLSHNISFGKKIPIAQCKIFDEKQNRFVPATVSELDCRDEEDIDILEFSEERFAFKHRIINDMWHKFDAKDNPQEDSNNYKFYIIGTDKDELVGVCETYNAGSISNLEYISRVFSNEYKLIGQCLLAAVANKEQKQQIQAMIVPHPTTEKFYTEECGFHKTRNGVLELKESGIKSLIKNVEAKTQSPFIDLQA